jgi:hypothetical protein
MVSRETLLRHEDGQTALRSPANRCHTPSMAHRRVDSSKEAVHALMRGSSICSALTACAAMLATSQYLKNAKSKYGLEVLRKSLRGRTALTDMRLTTKLLTDTGDDGRNEFTVTGH